jgi:hypothetical protein
MRISQYLGIELTFRAVGSIRGSQLVLIIQCQIDDFVFSETSECALNDRFRLFSPQLEARWRVISLHFSHFLSPSESPGLAMAGFESFMANDLLSIFHFFIHESKKVLFFQTFYGKRSA